MHCCLLTFLLPIVVAIGLVAGLVAFCKGKTSCHVGANRTGCGVDYTFAYLSFDCVVDLSFVFCETRDGNFKPL